MRAAFVVMALACAGCVSTTEAAKSIDRLTAVIEAADVKSSAAKIGDLAAALRGVTAELARTRHEAQQLRAALAPLLKQVGKRP